MIRHLLLPAFTWLLFFTLSCSGESKRQVNKTKDKISGVDSNKGIKEEKGIGGVYNFGEDIEKGPIGSIKIYPLSADSALFFLNVNRGAPSYNMGLLFGKIKRKQGTWHYSVDDGKLTCSLQFTFSGETLDLKILSAQDNCGFGYGVNVAHGYQRSTTEIPTYFLNGEGDTVRFEELNR